MTFFSEQLKSLNDAYKAAFGILLLYSVNGFIFLFLLLQKQKYFFSNPLKRCSVQSDLIKQYL